jgi:predicted nucleic-acid-binding protein
MRAVDTNVLVRLLARDDTKQAAVADAAIEKGAWVSHLVLAEAVWVLDAVYARTPKQLIAALDLLISHASLVLQDADVVAAAILQFRAKPALGFSDCLVLEIARKAGHLPLATFDRALSRIAGAERLS